MKQPDIGHQLTDKKLAELERRIAAEYKKAADELQKTIDDYFEKFKDRDDKKLKLLQDGKITDQQYKQWRLAQIGRGKRFEALRDRLAERYTKANEVAAAYINGDMAKIYAMNHAYTIKNVKDQADGVLNGIDFTLFDEHTVKRLLVEQPDLMPHYPPGKAVDRKIDLAWGGKQITAQVTQGILTGESIPKIAKRLQNNIPHMEQVSAVRAARTAITAAENAGRQDARNELESKGVILNKRWLATLDNRTRHDHAMADGQIVMNDMPFEVGGEYLMFPGDSSMGASGWNLYNCRCSCSAEIVGFKSILTAEQRKRAKIVVK